MFGRKQRLEEDLERLRRANLPPEERQREEEAAEQKQAEQKAAFEKATWRDYVAMAVAIISLILPYALAIFAVLGVIWFFISKFYLGV